MEGSILYKPELPEPNLPPPEVIAASAAMYGARHSRRYGLLEWPSPRRKLDAVDPGYRDWCPARFVRCTSQRTPRAGH